MQPKGENLGQGAASEVGVRSAFVIMPIYNGAKTIGKVIDRIPSFGSLGGIIVVDDGSSDTSLQIVTSISRGRSLTIAVHERNRGYGGAQKTLMKRALELGAELVILLHQDGQYPPEMVPLLSRVAIENPDLDIILSPRTHMREGGMSLIKYVGNRALTAIQNFILGARFSEYHTGMRLYTRKALKSLDISSYTDDYFFDTQVLAEGVAKGLSFGEVPIPTYYGPEVSQNERILSYGMHCILETLRSRMVYRYATNTSRIKRFDSASNEEAPPVST